MPDINGHLEQIFNNFICISYYLVHFKEFIVVILCKQEGIRDFTNTKSYQLISLLNIIGKIMEVMLIAKISYMAITYNFLSKTQFRD